MTERFFTKPDPYQRYQRGMAVVDLFPETNSGICACGCGAVLPKRKRRWATEACQQKALEVFWVAKGDTRRIRKTLYKRDKGICAMCGRAEKWEADHILPVHQGGGYCDLDNFQTLCVSCHKIKTHSNEKA